MKSALPAVKKQFEYNLEALRAFASFTVVMNHIVVFSALAPPYKPLSGILSQDYPGHLCVLIFFILSGYVIGLTTRKTPLMWSTAGTYVRKRLLRLYPIYIIVILAVLLTSHRVYPNTTIIGNLFFLERKSGGSFFYEMQPAWSLHYEVLFYLLFIPLSIYAIRPSWVFAASLAVGVFFQVVVPIESVSMYGYGFSFWVTGLYLSQNTFPEFIPSRASLIGLLLLVLCSTQLNFVYYMSHFHLKLDRMPGRHFMDMEVLLSDLSYLPLGIVLIGFFTNKQVPFQRWLLVYVLLSPLFHILLELYLYLHRHLYVGFLEHSLAHLYFVLAICMLAVGHYRGTKPVNRLPQFMVGMGSISYGVYLTHMVIMITLSYMGLPLLAQTVLLLFLTISISWVLEKKIQPVIASLLTTKRRTKA